MKLSRRALLVGTGAVAATSAGALLVRDKVRARLDRMTVLPSFFAAPTPLPHDPTRDRATVWQSQGLDPAGNIDSVMAKAGGMARFVGADDVVVVKVSAQWWNQGMTNVAAARRVLEHIANVPGFRGEIVVIENTHFWQPSLAVDDPARGLTRAWSHPSVVNVDVPGWQSLGDLLPWAASSGLPISFVGLVDAGPNSLATDAWFDPEHKHGVYGGDSRGPIESGAARDGYHWDFGRVFSVPRSRVADAKTPLSWPRFTSPRTGNVIDLRDGVFRREPAGTTTGGRNGQHEHRLVPTNQPLTFINITTANEHGSTGFTGAVKSTMGLVDMSAGALGTDPRVRGYQSVHYFGRTGRANSSADPTWRMAGPLAYWATHVRRAALTISVAQWVARMPHAGYDESDDMRHHAACRVQTDTVMASVDPVAIDATLVRRVVHPLAERGDAMLDLRDPDSKVSKFLQYYRAVAGHGTLDESLIEVV